MTEKNIEESHRYRHKNLLKTLPYFSETIALYNINKIIFCLAN